MKIFWDSYGIGQRGSGVSHYADHLRYALQSLQVHPTVLASNGALPADWAGAPLADSRLCDRMSRIKLTRPLVLGRTATHVALTLSSETVIFHGLSNFNGPWQWNKPHNLKTVLTIHDLTPMLAPEAVSWSLHTQLKWLYPNLLSKIDIILCDSQWTKQTVEHFYPQALGKTKALSLGYPSFKPRYQPKQKSSRNRILVLSIGRSEPYKNLDLLGDILHQSPNNIDICLVTNQDGIAWAQKKYGALIEEGRLIIKSNLTECDLDLLYRKADVYCHPSFYEGFGLPIAEAAAYGLPVVYMSGSASDETALPGFSMGLHRSQTVTEWVNAIEKMQALAKQPNHDKAMAQAIQKKPSWHDVASELAKLYTSLET